MGVSQTVKEDRMRLFVEYRESNPNKFCGTYVPNYSPAVVEYRPTSQLLPHTILFLRMMGVRIAHTGKQIYKICCFNSLHRSFNVGLNCFSPYLHSSVVLNFRQGSCVRCVQFVLTLKRCKRPNLHRFQ